MATAFDPIGIFDSGLGGLSVVQAIRSLLPAENLLYVADSAHAPYGGRSPAFIRERALTLAGFLQAQQAKALVVACNTATAAAAETLRARFALPVIAMEPAVKLAAAATRCNVVGVLATQGTLASARFAGLLARFAGDVRVVTRPAADLVRLVERGELDGAQAIRRVEAHVNYLLHHGSDTIVLGCTHYPHLRPLIERAVGPDVAIIDTGPAVARQLRARLTELGLLRASAGSGSLRIGTSAAVEPARAVSQHLIRAHYGAVVVEALPALRTSQCEPGIQGGAR
ncbi:MAG: glutamate racemase [Nitrococcus sp.]|nr:glutamate racemase [Nitrococcus sp.]